jgi:AraC-like DNA-binding protein
MAGGVDTTINNFEPLATAVLLYTGQQQTPTSATNTHWFWWLTAIANLLLIVLLLWIWKRRRIPIAPQQPEVTADEPLMQRLCLLMEEQRPYLNSDLKRQDVADLLQTNRTYITDCIKATRGQTFSQFINSYRVEHAKQLLSRHPDKKMSAVAIESGFNTESSFFRAFKAETGITPNEWRATLEK